VMRITNRDYFMVKGVGSVRDLPVSAWLLEEFRALASKPDAEGNPLWREWLIPGATVTDRHEVTHYLINDWMEEVYNQAILAQQLPEDTEVRTAYDFRKQAGSELYQKTNNILQVSKWLGHQSVHTTTRWYVNLIDGLPSLA
jgi:integrase